MSNFVYLTRERLREIELELNQLQTAGRKDMAARIAEARAHGDLSENAEYDAAKDAQALMEFKISKLQEMLSKAQIIDKGKNLNGEVNILSTVSLRNLNTDKTMSYTLVSPEEADLAKGKISITSPVGKSLMGAKKGEVVESKVPAGVIKFEILEVE